MSSLTRSILWVVVSAGAVLFIAPGRAEDLAPLMCKAAGQGIPVVCVNTDARTAPHVATVCVDSAVSGSLVGELMGRFLRGRGRLPWP